MRIFVSSVNAGRKHPTEVTNRANKISQLIDVTQRLPLSAMEEAQWEKHEQTSYRSRDGSYVLALNHGFPLVRASPAVAASECE